MVSSTMEERSLSEEYRRAVELARKIADEVGEPLFYREHRQEISLSDALFPTESIIAQILDIIDVSGCYPGHGLTHVRKVAIDAGALILVEMESFAQDASTRRMVLLAHIAGLLHDICRKEKNHAERGAKEAQRILEGFPLESDERMAIAGAIENHEAFRPFRMDGEPTARLLSDALYDADKFRWGPDNFTETLWAMTAPRAVPLADLLPRFAVGMEGIAKIKTTFRTAAGRMYGPDFIDRGLEIGRRLHAELTGRKDKRRARRQGSRG
jgi:hypothetical protein